MKFNLHIVILLYIIFLAVQQNSFSVATRVKKVGHVSTPTSLPKEIAAVERFARKLTDKAKSKKTVSEGEEDNDTIMAFSSDYHPPKSHPPKNH